jgi:hypothetical protein
MSWTLVESWESSEDKTDTVSRTSRLRVAGRYLTGKEGIVTIRMTAGRNRVCRADTELRRAWMRRSQRDSSDSPVPNPFHRANCT